MIIRDEQAADIEAISALTTAMAFASHREAAIVDALRAASALAVSLVAVENGEIIGHIAFSTVTINGRDVGWFGLGPVSVEPERQRDGIGKALITEGLARLRTLGAGGCVLAGDPAYYSRFGFENDTALYYEGLPPEYFMRLALRTPVPRGAVTFHKGFDAV